ncbi:MAG: archaemetzincin [Candidatus Omnitrophota bacterium]
MRKSYSQILLKLTVTIITLIGASSPGIAEDFDLSPYQKLIPLHEPKLPPGPYDWMSQHRENDQSFYEYIKSNPIRSDEQRKYIYIVLLGNFDQAGQEIIRTTARFIEAYFNLQVQWLDPISLGSIPDKARRIHPQTLDNQILTTYVLEDILKPILPDDAFSVIAFTSSDLWPGEGWNFVFGQASIQDRVGVWSIYRNGNPNGSHEENKLCLLRTVKTGTHELGHMFSLPHCLYFECNMNGSNHRSESDRRPLWLCPVCLSKLMWNTGDKPGNRFQSLIKISNELGIDITILEQSLDILIQ